MQEYECREIGVLRSSSVADLADSVAWVAHSPIPIGPGQARMSPPRLALADRPVRLMRAASSLMRESQNTQSPGLRFRALLTEGGAQRVHLHRA